MSKEKLLTAKELHNFATELAWNSQEISSKKFFNQSVPIVNYAIFNIFHDAMIVHQSIRGLVYNGWSSSGAILVRTMIDLTISLIAIVKSANSTLAAFKYFNHNHKQVLRDNNFSLEERRNIRKLIKNQTNQLSTTDKEEADKFLKEKNRPYWFCGEWSKPTDVLEQFASSHIIEEYQRLSSAAHGGFYGLKYFRDRFDEYEITARLPIGRQAILVSVSSSRKLIGLVSIRNQYEDLGLEQSCEELMERLITIKIPKNNLS